MFIQAILVALISTLSNWWVSHLITRTWLYPIITGTLVGIAMGEPLLGMQAAAYINLAYLGWITAGGTMPGNLPVAAVFGTAMTILSGAEPSLAVTFAVPFSLLGIMTNQLYMSLNALWVHKAEDYLDKGNITGMRMMNYIPSGILSFILNGLPAFALVYFGAGFMQNFLDMIPASLVTAMTLVGAIMPALGISMLLSFMGKKKIFPFFFVGFFLTVYLNLDTMAVAIFASLLGLIFYMTDLLSLSNEEEEAL